mmetsp:Transcript_26178/g.55078  ORF Transcript_26178/g.55078 Transcript_26178/m.55078 type:complete len:106 (+) Transcript_26178:151-468(+)
MFYARFLPEHITYFSLSSESIFYARFLPEHITFSCPPSTCTLSSKSIFCVQFRRQICILDNMSSIRYGTVRYGTSMVLSPPLRCVKVAILEFVCSSPTKRLAHHR